MAPELAGSVDGPVTLSQVFYNAEGNVWKVLGPTTGECQTFVYDPAFADYQTAAYRWLGASCGGIGLSTSAQVDRGLGLTIQTGGMNNETRKIDTDTFGRPVAMWGPGPSGGVVLETTLSYSPSDQAVHWVHAIREAADVTRKGRREPSRTASARRSLR